MSRPNPNPPPRDDDRSDRFGASDGEVTVILTPDPTDRTIDNQPKKGTENK